MAASHPDSTSWASRSLLLGLADIDAVDLYNAVGVALRSHAPKGHLVIGAQDNITQAIHKYTVADIDEMNEILPVLKPSVDTDPAAVVVVSAGLAFPKLFAHEKSIQTLIYLEHKVNKITLCYLTCHAGMGECEAAWL